MFDKSLVGPIGTIVKVNTLQEYGVDKFFVLENDNVDTSQQNVVFIARGECGRHAETIASTLTFLGFRHDASSTLLGKLTLLLLFCLRFPLQAKSNEYEAKAIRRMSFMSFGSHDVR